MTILVSALGVLFSFCYRIVNNYLVAMIIFTFVTKIMLFPISVWTQKNGIKMVRIQPELYRIKIKYFGDKDRIADETAELYKREKYNAFVGTVPLLIQIIIFICILDVVKYPEYASLSNNDMVFGKLLFYANPTEVGGGYWLVPFLAGLSAYVLSIMQNKLNPLQAGQTRKSQIGTMLFSVGISLALGAFVPLGVATYWICSNLFTIVQQYILNLILNPFQYVAYDALEETRKQLSDMENIGKRRNNNKKQYKGKEKKDYKRFFSTTNKHLVFYSENNGFYKYFERTIDYLLNNTNIIIHYVTSDPLDQIFEKEKTNSRIKAYYIGEKKLITLMMKMDADVVVMTMPDLENYHIKRSYVRKEIEYVYMFHYPLSTHMVLHTGALDHYDTILCVGDFQFEEIRKQEEIEFLPAKRLISCGYGQLEKLQEQYNDLEKATRERKKILLAPSWQQDNILDSCIDIILNQLLGKGWDIVVRPHPEYVKRYGDRMGAIVNRYESYSGNDLIFELDFTSNNSIFDSDVVITDWSGTAYEFSFVTGKPAMFINTPMKVNNPDYVKLEIEPLEIKLRNQVGISLDTNRLDKCYETICELLSKQDEYINNNVNLRNKYIANYGHSDEIAAKYIITSIQEKILIRKGTN